MERLRNLPPAFWIFAQFAGVFGLFVLKPGPSSNSAGSGNPVVEDRLRCAATSVALQQLVYARAETGIAFPDYLQELESRVNRLHRYVRGLTQSNDPAALAFRPIMIDAEAARDKAAAEDPDAYMRVTWPEVQACDTRINGSLSP